VGYVRVFNHYFLTPYLLLGVIEFFILVCSVYVGERMRSALSTDFNYDGISIVTMQSLVFGLVMLGCTLSVGVYSSQLREGFTGVVARTFVSYFLLAVSILTVLYYAFPALYIGRGVLAMSAVSAVLLVLPLRALFYYLVGLNKLKRNVLILGAGNRAQELLELISRTKESASYVLNGCFPVEGESIVVDKKYIVPQKQNILDYSLDNCISEIIVATDKRRKIEGGQFPLNLLMDCRMEGIHISEAISFFEKETGKIEFSLIKPSWIVFSTGYGYSQFKRVVKRLTDILVSIISLVLSLPLMILTAIAIYIDDGENVLYKQKRIGYRGKVFTLYKFRSMRIDAEKNGAVWAKQKDNRVTRVGKFIRSTRLDELPQIYNVIKGDMSFVGPRPERPEFVKDLINEIPYYNERHKVKPGIMGWAQLKYPYGASIEDAAQKLRYDLYYTKNSSLVLDLLIIIQTVEVLLLGKGVR